MKKLLVALALILALTGCAKVVDTKHEDVKVTIVDVRRIGAWVQHVKTGKTTNLIYHRERWEIKVSFNEEQYVVEVEEQEFDQYKDKIGQKIKGKLEIKTYDNGQIQYGIVSLE